MHSLPTLVDPEPQPAGLLSAQQLRTVGSLVCTGTARPAGLFVGVAHERAGPLPNQFQVILGRDHQAGGHRRRAHQLVELVQPRVLADLDSAPAEPGKLGGD